jgi:molybdopterin synthase sulfur carrier subunit
MTVRVLLFAGLRETCGCAETTMDVAAGSSARDCLDVLVQRHPGLERLRQGLVAAINESYADWDEQLSDGDTVAFIPPVSGG